MLAITREIEEPIAAPEVCSGGKLVVIGKVSCYFYWLLSSALLAE